MLHEITVPEVSEGVTAGTVVTLSVGVGDRVEEDQTLLELETDKAVVAIPSTVAGTVKEIKVAEDDKVEVGAVIMTVESEDSEQSSPPPDDEATAEPEADKAAADSASKEEKEQEKEKQEEPSDKEATPQESRQQGQTDVASDEKDSDLDLTPVRRDDQVAPAAPSVRRIARDLGVDIYQVQGSGPGGRISEDDVRSFVRSTMQQLSGGAPVSVGEFTGLHAQRPLPDFSKWGEISTEPLSTIRELTADAMGYAWSTIPMVTQYDKAEIEELEEFRKEHNDRLTGDAKLTMTAILLKVCAAALKTFPKFNSSLDLARKELIFKHYQHIGVAVDTPNGLLVPVIKDVGDKGIEELAAELNELAERTRDRKISPAEMEGGCFIISNLGGIGGNAFTPIVYAPQVAILGVSRAEMQPVWNGREFEPRLLLPLSLSYDHRVIDGAEGARFLRWICQALEQPLHLVMKG
jgi:pyruvate dehydrogenase E2 component (dihydrolipoamide acetyltransferase)